MTFEPLDVTSTVAGAVIALIAAYLISWLWRPRVKVLGFEAVEANFGKLYKFRFELKGRSAPGLCCLHLKWDKGEVLAKWDETANPLGEDQLGAFKPELVPFTFYQPLFRGRTYAVPVIVETSAEQHTREVFSGWWFGKSAGYCPNSVVNDGTVLTLTLMGDRFSRSWRYSVRRICGY